MGLGPPTCTSGPPTANQCFIAQNREAQEEVPQTAVHLVADRGWIQKGAIPIDPHVKMPNFTAEINMFLAWIQQNLFWI